MLIVQELGKIYFCRKHKKVWGVVAYVKFTQASENPFLMLFQVDLRHEVFLQSEVPPKQKGSTSGTESVHGYQTLCSNAHLPILNINHRNTIHTIHRALLFYMEYHSLSSI